MSGSPAIAPGARFGPYEVEAQIGEGGMAVVARGHHVETGERVALKILTSARRAETPGLVDRLHREASVIQALDRIPYVVGFVEVFRDQVPSGPPGADVLVLEYIQGRSLQTLLGGPPLEVMQVLEWMGHACHALHDMHEAGFVHRDLKPDNLMLVGDPDVPLRLIDFNSAGSVATTRGRLTQMQGTFPYTPAYLAPECFDGIPADASADVYALGITFAELLLGRHPLLAPGEELETNSAWRQAHDERPFPDLTRERPAIPAALQQILADATAKLRRDRIPDAVKLWERLKAVWDALQAEPSPASSVPAQTSLQPPEVSKPPVPAAAPSSRGPMLVAGLGVLVMLGAVGAGGMWWLEQRQLAHEAEVERLEAERRAREAQRAEEERQRLEAERRERERLERERIEAERRAREAAIQQRAEKRAAALGATAMAPKVSDPETLDKLKNSTRFGSHHLYDKRMGTAGVEQIGEVLFFEGEQTYRNDRVLLEGVVTEVDRRGVTLEGRLSIRYTDYYGNVDRCGRKGRIRMNASGHLHYFRASGDCKAWHDVDLFADDAWLEAHPAHKPRW